jgi:hypothetical protein
VCCLGAQDHFNVSLEDEVVRGSIIVQDGQLLWPPPPPPAPAPGAATAAAATPAAEKAVPVEPNYFANTMKDVAMYTGGNVLCWWSVLPACVRAVIVRGLLFWFLAVTVIARLQGHLMSEASIFRLEAHLFCVETCSSAN